MRGFYCRNEASVEMLPLEITEAPLVERPALKDKAAYRKWCADPTTDHAFVTFAEGESANLRVGKDNPCRRVWGLIAEYDARVPADWRELVQSGLGGEVSGAWFCRSFSGNGRILFTFSEPVLWSGREEWDAFCDIAFSELKLGKLLPGFSDKESRSVTQIFEIGTEWEQVGGGSGEGEPIAARVLREWQLRAIKKAGRVRRGQEIPFSRLQEKGRELFGDRFPEGFEVGARVTRFWEEGADAESVLVREDGLTCFTGDRGFVTWGEVFGADWVRGETQAVLESATAGVWWCPGSGKYYVNGTNTGWQALGREDLVRWMKARGVSAAVGKGELVSELDMAIIYIQKKQSIHGIFPRVFAPDGVFRWNGKVLDQDVHQEADDAGAGDDGRLSPRLGRRIRAAGSVLGDGVPEQLRWWLAYWAHAYRSALTGVFTQE